MTDLIAAHSQMVMSLGFHIIFAAIGMAMPLMMTIAEWRWLRSGDRIYLTLAKRWAKGTGGLFAVGAVSGTALSFELGLHWPALGRSVDRPALRARRAVWLEASPASHASGDRDDCRS